MMSARTKRIMNNLPKDKKSYPVPVSVLPDTVVSDPVTSDPVEPDSLDPGPVLPDLVVSESISDPVVPDPILPGSVVSDPIVSDPVVPNRIVSETLVPNPVVAETVKPDLVAPHSFVPDLVDLYTLNTGDGSNLLVCKPTKDIISSTIDTAAVIEQYVVSTENGVLHKEFDKNVIIDDLDILSSITSILENEKFDKDVVNQVFVSHSPQQSRSRVEMDNIIEDETQRCEVYDDFEKFCFDKNKKCELIKNNSMLDQEKKNLEKVDQNSSEEDNSEKDPEYEPTKDSIEDIDISGTEKILDYDDTNQKKKLSVSQKRKLAQARRVRGKSYEGYKRSKEKIVSNTQRHNREMKVRCSHSTKEKLHENSFLCFNISDDERKELFSKFWKLASWGEKRIFVTSNVTTRAIRRRRKEFSNSVKRKKPLGHDYFLTTNNGNRLKVCRKMFLNTLSLGEDSLKRWTKQETTVNGGSSDSDETLQTSTRSTRTPLKTLQSNKRLRKQNLRQTVVQWLDLIPKVPSHYCRASTSRQYVDNSFVSKQNMYNIFVKWCSENNEKSTHLKEFKLVLTEKKISIHKPRKDQCDTCVGFKLGTVTTDAYNAHRQKQEAGRSAKAKMKELASESTLVVTMDLQSVLTCPKLLASESYYKLKLQVHNFTIYALNNKKVTLYVWHEATGGVSSNEFASCVIDYLSEEVKNNFKCFILISDGCNYQNRNKTLASALNDFSKEKDVTIQQLYLEKGHTMMEADSVHSTLEHYFYEPINSPTDYVARMRMARPSNPYNVKVLDFTFFKNYELPSNFSSIRPGKRVRDPVVVDIRQLKYLPNGQVFYTLDYTDNWQIISYKREVQILSSYPALYKRQLPISDDKFKHLQELKGVIEVDHHPFYNGLPHQPRKNKKEPFNN